MTQDERAEALEMEAAEAAGTEQAALEQLQEENRRLRGQIEQFSEQQAQEDGLSDRLGEAEQANDQLRRRYAAAALAEGMGRAARAVGISPEAAGAYAHRFRCEVDAEGQVRIEPNPTEFLLEQMRENPLLRESAQRQREAAQARAVIDGAVSAEEADPVSLMTSLDRSAPRKARFIARHGSQGYLALAARARRKGYVSR
ncbi:MAG: hypothetical protein WCK05_00330 [Planctomycetota bacterium]